MILRLRFDRCLIGAIWLPFSKNKLDTPITNHVTNSEETGMDRVKKIFQKDEYGFLSYKLSNIAQVTYMGLFTGLICGGCVSGRNAYIDFMNTNQATGYQTPHTARKLLQEDIFRSFLKGGGIFAFKIGIFVSTFMILLTLSIEYRNKETPIEYTVSGLVSGALYRISYGIRGMFSGAFLGGSLGLIFGTIIIIIEQFTNHSFQKFSLWSASMHEARSKETKFFLKNRDEKDKEYPVIYEHNMKSQELGKEYTLETLE